MKTKFIPIDYDYFDFDEGNFIRIFGRDDTGRRVCVIDSCPVYFWAILTPEVAKSDKKIKKLVREIEKIQLDVKGRHTRVEKVEVHDKKFLGEDVKALKIFATNYKDLHDIADELDFDEIEKRRGYDLGLITHYIMEKKINPLHWYDVEGEVLDNSQELGGVGMAVETDLCLKADKVKEIDNKRSQSKKQGKGMELKPKVLAYDIETDEVKIGEGEILMISLVCGDFKKIITWDKDGEKSSKLSEDIKDYVEYVEDEAELIEKFVEYTKDVSPDFLVGYFSDGFDLPYIKARAERFNMKLPLSLDGTQPRFSRGGGILTGKIKGLPHIDLWKFIRTAYSQYLNSETLSLDEVSKELLGNKKEDFKLKHSSNLDHGEWDDYYRYNLQDSVLTHDLFMKVWKDLVEFTRIIKAPVVEVSRNGMSTNVETFILNNLERFDEIPEKRPVRSEILERRQKGKYEGGFIYEPTTGIYENIVMFDFTSSYASVIVSYNLSKSTFVPEPEERKDEEYFEINTGDETVHFEKEEGFIPKLLRDIIERRKEHKKELKKNPDDNVKRARSNAFKLLANSYYGYQGFFGARYYSREAAAATAAFARKSIKDVMENIRNRGYNVVYGDTDSMAFLRGDKSKKDMQKLLKEMNSELPGIMELELEGFFDRGIWITKRSGKTGAKKKYALIDEDGKIKIRGFETVRRDWCSLARHVQNKVLELVLKHGGADKALEFLRNTIKDIKNRNVAKEDLVIRTQLKKPLSEYKAVSPHVIAARKMKEQEVPIKQGGLVEYYVSTPAANGESGKSNNKKLVRERVKLPFEEGAYDIEYYLNHQILPAVENILKVFDVDVKELIEGKKQTTLGDF